MEWHDFRMRRWLLFFVISHGALAAMRVTTSLHEVHVDWEEGDRTELTDALDPGAPDLPHWSRLLAVPPGHRAELVDIGGIETVTEVRGPVVPVAARRHCGGPPPPRLGSP